MGSYTEHHGFYKPDSQELVDVERHLNFNLKRADFPVVALTKYIFTDVNSVSSSFPSQAGSGYRYYKTRSNSIWYFPPEHPTTLQDGNSQVDSWSTSGISFVSGYENRKPGDPILRTQISYKKEEFSDTVFWRGQIQKTSQATWTMNSRVKVLNMPASITPSSSRFLFAACGNVPAGFMVANIEFSSDGGIYVIPYGQNGTTANRFIDLGSLEYSL